MTAPPPNYTSPSKIYLCGTAPLLPDFTVRLFRLYQSASPGSKYDLEITLVLCDCILIFDPRVVSASKY